MTLYLVCLAISAVTLCASFLWSVHISREPVSISDMALLMLVVFIPVLNIILALAIIYGAVMTLIARKQ